MSFALFGTFDVSLHRLLHKTWSTAFPPNGFVFCLQLDKPVQGSGSCCDLLLHECWSLHALWHARTNLCLHGKQHGHAQVWCSPPPNCVIATHACEAVKFTHLVLSVGHVHCVLVLWQSLNFWVKERRIAS